MTNATTNLLLSDTHAANFGTERRRGWRSRWAAIGAAVAVSFGAGGIYIGNASATIGGS